MSSLIKLTRTIHFLEQFIIYNACTYLCMYTNIIWLCMIKARIRWCSCRVKNILTLGKLLSLWFCFLLHSILFFYISNLLSYIHNNFKLWARSPHNGNHFSSWASEASPTLGCLIETSRDILYIYIYIYVCLSYVKSRGITWIKHAHAQSQYWAVKSDQWHPYYSFRLYARAALVWTEDKRSLRNEKLKANRAS